jgi:xanthine dehydrogenase accessory factor
VSDVITAVDAARAAISAEEGGGAVAVATAVTADGSVRRMLVDASGAGRGSLGDAALDATAMQLATQALQHRTTEPITQPAQVAGDDILLYIEAHFPPEHFIIVGAGHIAVPLAALGMMLDFSVTVLDDREEFATTERFDEGVVVRRADFAADPFAGVRIDNGTWIALVTRGHRWDFDCLRRLLELETRPRYIGMIGSRRRVRAAFHALLEAGTPRELLAAIHAPIGLELGAETPAEIAVSIAAEITALRRGVAAPGSTAERERVLDRLLG